jgi:hypothetical protein
VSTRASEYGTPADRRRGQHMCAMAHQLLRAMATGDVVRVDTTQGVVTGRVTSNEHHRAQRPVEEVDGGRLVFMVGGQRVHVATVREVDAP